MILWLYKLLTPTFKFSSLDITLCLTTILCLPLPTLLCSLLLNKALATMPTTALLTCLSPPSHLSLRRVPRCLLFPTPDPINSHHPRPVTSSLVPPNMLNPSSSGPSSWKMVRFWLKISLFFHLSFYFWRPCANLNQDWAIWSHPQHQRNQCQTGCRYAHHQPELQHPYHCTCQQGEETLECNLHSRRTRADF